MQSIRLSILSSFGIALFTLLYIYAASLYPGGNQANLYTSGFDWVNNYWCNLMNATAMNGQANPGKNTAVLANSILCLSLMAFFVQFANTFSRNKLRSRIVKTAGILSMISAMFLFTSSHDVITIIASVFGVAALIGVVLDLYQSDLSTFKFSGGICLLLLGLNNVIYYTGFQIEWLPLLQKVTFLLVLLWILGLNVVMSKKNELVIDG